MYARALTRLTSRVRPASGWILGGFVGLHTAVLLTVHSDEFRWSIAEPLLRLTNGWVPASLTATVVMGGLILGGWFGVVGGLRRADLGLPVGRRAGVQVLNAMVLIYLLWGVAQLLVVSGGLAGLTKVSMNPSWVRPLNPELVGASAATVLAGAVLEEVMYRGFLFVHLVLALRRWGVPGYRTQVGGALLGSQGLFGLNHIPAGLGAGMEGAALALYVLQVTFVGIAFTVLFLQTQNLLFVVAVHAFINNPELPFVTATNSSFVAIIVVLGLMVGHTVLARLFSSVLGARRPSLRPPQSHSNRL